MADLRTAFYRELTRAFEHAVADYARHQPLAQGWRIVPVFDERFPDLLVQVDGRVYFQNFRIIFKFLPHGLFGQQHCLLDLQLQLSSQIDENAYSIYDVIDLFTAQATHFYTLAWLTTAEVLGQAVAWLGRQLDLYLDAIGAGAGDAAWREQLEKHVERDLQAFFAWDQPPEPEQMMQVRQLYQRLMRERLLLIQADLLLKGDLVKACSRLNGLRGRSQYETHLLAYLTSLLHSAGIDAPPVAGQSRSRHDLRRASAARLAAALAWPPSYGERCLQMHKLATDPRTALVIYLGSFLMLPAWGGLFWLLEKVFIQAVTHGCLYATGHPLLALFPPAFLCGIAMTYHLRYWLYRLFFQHTARLRIRLDALANSLATDRFMRLFFRTILIISVIYILLLARSNLCFYTDGFRDNTAILSWQGRYYDYREIAWVEKSRAEPDNSSEGDNGSEGDGRSEGDDSLVYTLVLQDGRLIRINDYASSATIKARILPILRDAGVLIEWDS